MAGFRGAVIKVIAAGALLAVIPGCDTMLAGLVGEKRNGNAPVKPQAPPPVVNSTSFVNDGLLNPGFGGQPILPPTLSADDDAFGATGDAPPVATGSRRPLAVVPLSADGAALASLGEAARRAKPKPDDRFVLLVLAPQALDAVALDRTNMLSRQAAQAAIRALGQSGIGADRIQLSLATSPNAGPGEMRLYPR